MKRGAKVKKQHENRPAAGIQQAAHQRRKGGVELDQFQQTFISNDIQQRLTATDQSGVQIQRDAVQSAGVNLIALGFSACGTAQIHRRKALYIYLQAPRWYFSYLRLKEGLQFP